MLSSLILALSELLTTITSTTFPPKRTLVVATPYKSPSPAVTPSVKSPSFSPPDPAVNTPSPSPTAVDFLPSPPLTPSDLSVDAPSVTLATIFSPPSKALAPSQNGVTLNRFALQI
ncbi:hypothetical protein AAZX31_17G170100 [Glycine max]